jgi:hypothetical protein
MSDQVRRQGGGAVWPWPVANPTLGVTAEEIKLQRGANVKDPTVQPIPEPRATEFLNPTTSSEHLRLAPPGPANPQVTATGPTLYHFKVRGALDKARGEVAQDLHKFINSDAANQLPEQSRTQMKASLGREQAMMTLLRNVQEMQQGIYARVIGSSEA